MKKKRWILILYPNLIKFDYIPYKHKSSIGARRLTFTENTLNAVY